MRPVAPPDAYWIRRLLEQAATWCQNPRYARVATRKVTDTCGRPFVLQLYRFVGTAEHVATYSWRLRPPGSEVVVGAGRIVTPDVRTIVPHTWAAVVAPEFAGCGIYAAVLKVLRRTLKTPIESDLTLSAGAIASWRKAGAVLAERDGVEVFRLNPAPAPRTAFTPAEVRAALRTVGISARLIDLAQLRAGMRVELEHGRRYPALDVTGDDPVATAKIALAHLVECPDYYVKLARMERAPCPAERRPRR